MKTPFEKLPKYWQEVINKHIFKTSKKNFDCYEIHRPNIPDDGCKEQCKECKSEQALTDNTN